MHLDIRSWCEIWTHDPSTVPVLDLLKTVQDRVKHAHITPYGKLILPRERHIPEERSHNRGCENRNITYIFSYLKPYYKLMTTAISREKRKAKF
jgi:hypothetical protein